MATATATAGAGASSPTKGPVAVVCVGMAGSGKTTFMQRINSYLHSQNKPPYVLNLDPAVKSTPFESNIDIRDSINYKEVMSQYNLGPNGGILTSLNLFATKVDQIMGILEKRCGITGPASSGPDASSSASSAASTAPADQLASGTAASTSQTPGQGQVKRVSKPIEHILVDTPGQIEVFVWSASGQILLSSLASSFPTVLAYIIDTPRTASTSTFMSNMLYACSILYKTKLPMILVFNKTDVQPADFAKEWMTDFEAFQAALRKEEETGMFGGLSEADQLRMPLSAAGTAPAVGGSGYMSSLLNSMSLVLEEFYKHLSVVGVSSMTGAGVDDFFAAVADKGAEFERDYRPELDRRREGRERDRKAKREKEMSKLMQDMNMESAQGGMARAAAAKRKAGGRSRQKREEAETISDLEDTDPEDEDEDDEDAEMANEPPAVLLEPDDEYADEDEDGEGAGVAGRHRQAASGAGGGGTEGLSAEDLSFLRYIRKSNING